MSGIDYGKNDSVVKNNSRFFDDIFLI